MASIALRASLACAGAGSVAASPPAAAMMEASTTNSFEVRAFLGVLAAGMTLFDQRHVAVLQIQVRCREIFRPVAVAAICFDLGFSHVSLAGSIAGEPVQRYAIRCDASLGDGGLQGQDQQAAMRLDHQTNTLIRSLDQDVCQCDLRPRMQVQFRLFDKNHLVSARGKERNKHRQGLRHPEPHVCDIDHVAGAAPCRGRQSANAYLDPRIIDGPRRDAPGEAKQFQIVFESLQPDIGCRSPLMNDAGDIVVEVARVLWPTCTDEAVPFRITSQAWQINQIPNFTGHGHRIGW